MSIKIEGGGSKENIIKSGTSNELLYNDEEIFLKKDLLDFVHPVGSIYWSSNDTDPGTLFGGTWQQIKDRFVLAAGDSYTVNNTGGEKTHTLTKEEMPSHNHIFRGTKGTVNVSGGNHRHIFKNDLRPLTRYGNERYTGRGDYIAGLTDATEYSGNLSMSGEFTPNGNIDNTGGLNGITQPHNNMPPYIVKYCWERIA